MTTDTALIEKREELKRRLTAGEYKTLVDMILAETNRVIQKITRRSGPLPTWLVAVILGLVLILIANAGIYLAGDWSTYRIFLETFGVRYGLALPFSILGNLFFIANTIVVNQYISRIFAFWRYNILDATESLKSLMEFEDWLKKTCNWRLHLLVTIFVATLLSLNGLSITSAQLSVTIGYGLIFSTMISQIIAYPILYLFVMIILLSARLRRYDLKLFVADPSSSELISRLSGELGYFAYYVAAFAAIVTLGTSWLGFLSLYGILLVLLYWLPIIAMFILNQTSLSSIIRRAKWKTLNEIQAKVEKLQAAENFENKETMDAINRLMDYHDRVKATRNSALDLGTTLHFINSLLLPLLAFLLGNLDKLMALLPQRP